MGSFNALKDLSRFPSGGGNTNYFKLSNDGDSARVRLLYTDATDITFCTKHEVKLPDRQAPYSVNCLDDDCPLCRAQYRKIIKVYVPVYDVKEQVIKLWERPRSFIADLQQVCARYGQDAPLYQTQFDIVRSGKPGDKQTKYFLYACPQTPEDRGVRLEDLGEVPNIIGGPVADRSAEDMEYFLANNCFPDNGGANTNLDISVDPTPRRVDRRTPANTTEAF